MNQCIKHQGEAATLLYPQGGHQNGNLAVCLVTGWIPKEDIGTGMGMAHMGLIGMLEMPKVTSGVSIPMGALSANPAQRRRHLGAESYSRTFADFYGVLIVRLVSKEDFIKWAETHKITTNVQEGLSFSEKSHSRYWVIPEKASAMPFFFSKILEGLDPWDNCYLWKDEGEWCLGLSERSLPYHRILANIMERMGIPEGFKGVIRYSKEELYDILTVLCSQTAYGWTVTDNIFVIPDHGRQIVRTDHCDDLVYVSFIDEGRLQEFVRCLANHDIKLPDRPRGASLKPEEGMKQ